MRRFAEEPEGRASPDRVCFEQTVGVLEAVGPWNVLLFFSIFIFWCPSLIHPKRATLKRIVGYVCLVGDTFVGAGLTGSQGEMIHRKGGSPFKPTG